MLMGNAEAFTVAELGGGRAVRRDVGVEIEDTDAARSRPEWTEGILRMMAWLGVGPGEYEGRFFRSDYSSSTRRLQRRCWRPGRRATATAPGRR